MSKVSNMTSSTTSTSRGDNRSLILAVATSTIAVAAAAGVAVYYYHNRRTAVDCDNDGGDDLTRTAPPTTTTATAKEEAIQQDNGTEIEIVTKSRGLVLEDMDLSSIEAEEPKVVALKFHETDEDEKHDLTPPSSEKEAGARITPIKIRRLASGRLNIPNENDVVSSSSIYPSKPQELADSPSVTTAETSMTDDDSIHVASSMTQ